MNKELLAFIRTLSENDKKTLSQKALKTTEEIGELAKAILPFENAAGTLHRFTDREKILDSSVDVILCALSIAHELKFNDQEIEDMMFEKSRKWSGIQNKESKVKFPLPYEIHITIENPNINLSSKTLERFKFDCAKLNVKPIIIDLQKNGESLMNDVMTSSVHFGDNNSAQSVAYRLGWELRKCGYKVIRTKIETVPWHPAAPSMEDKIYEMPPRSYFESHLRIVTTENRRNELEEIAKKFDAHLSRNFFKKINENEYIIMMTLRSSTETREFFEILVYNLKEELEICDFVVDKQEIEFAVFDSNTNHDEVWIKNEDDDQQRI